MTTVGGVKRRLNEASGGSASGGDAGRGDSACSWGDKAAAAECSGANNGLREARRLFPAVESRRLAEAGDTYSTAPFDLSGDRHRRSI